ncbi:unnamed protein product [Parascedosporium putredinis]|uniref:Ribosomal RNA methyltransferase FtsJ domain-containing protein n=1 Tax=Parascedosporium putredinis TaxID=1442378 RepID=A0A9P1MEF5_9PEZI|nr:unnamed protein product [Parascedosporium putredinis]CAI8000352.1 unnamed protein product [Parascedosporium putredinis]
MPTIGLQKNKGGAREVLSRVLIKGEKFGRAAWQDREAKLRQQMLNLFPENEEPSARQGVAPDAAPAAEPQPRGDVKIVSIDLQPMSPLQGIITLRADITHPATVPLLLKALDPSYDPKSMSQQAVQPVDLVISDGAPDVTGLHDLDIYVQSQLLFAALNLALCVLKPGGKFVAKIFRGRNVDLLYAQMKIFFEKVVVAKPRSSRASSVEAFIVCINFRPPPGFKASLEDPLGVGHKLASLVDERRRQFPIIAEASTQDPASGTWGGASATHSSFSSTEDVVEVEAFDEQAEEGRGADPVQPPTAPPYKRAIELRKAAGGANGKTAKA